MNIHLFPMNYANNLKITLPIPSIGVGGVAFNRNQQVLLIKRNQAPAQGFWSIPGGKLEPGESLIEACRREFHEETNIEVNVKHIVAVVDRRLKGFHYVIIDFSVVLADENTAVPIAQSYVAEAKWIDLDVLEQYDLVDGLAEIIKRTYKCSVKEGLVGLTNSNLLGTDFILPT